MDKKEKVWEKLNDKKPFVYQKSPIEKAVEKKQQGIKQSQEIKANSIQLASASRDASLIISTLIPFLYKDLSEEQLKEKWQMWRSWFLQRFEDKLQDIIVPFE